MELLASLTIVAILVGLLIPLLIVARDAARTTVCAANLKQLGTAWRLYLDEHGQFPAIEAQPDWRYGGADFIGTERTPVLADDRPINACITMDEPEDSGRFSLLFRCPSDRGVFNAGAAPSQRQLSILGPDGGQSCFEYYGNSYRANPLLLDSTRAGIDPLHRPLRTHDLDFVPANLLLLAGDAEWSYQTLIGDRRSLDASWHSVPDAGNMLAVDGSVRFVTFRGPVSGQYLISPRPGIPPGN